MYFEIQVTKKSQTALASTSLLTKPRCAIWSSSVPVHRAWLVAVYGASEGLDVLLLETSSPGGQAGSASRIENYLGFPTGISGQELAGRAYVQAQKFGAHMLIAKATQLLCDRKPYVIEVENGVEFLHALS